MKDVKEFAPDVADEVFNKIPRLRAENAALLVRAEKAEARIAWLERPVTDGEVKTAVLAVDGKYDVSSDDWAMKKFRICLTAALKIRMEPQS